MANTIQVRRGAESGAPTLASGEPGWFTDTRKFLIGTGSGNVTIGGFDRIAKTGAYTVVANDRAKIVDCTANTFTVTLTAAATLGSGFCFGVYNSGSGTITVDANGAETIRDPSSSATTKTLTQGQGMLLLCDGSGWLVIAQATSGGGGNTFSTIAVSGQSDVVADTSSDTLTFVAGSGMTITTNAGSDSVTFATSGTSGFGRVAKTANYTVISSDANYIIDCTANTFTLTLTAAATLGAGFMFGVANTGTGTITIDPNGSEIIAKADDAAATTLTLRQGQSVFLQTDGSNWYQVSGGLPLNPSGGSLMMADHGTSIISPRGYWTELPIGTVGSGNKDGQILTCTKVDGSSVAYPAWGLAGFRRVAKTGAYTVVAADADYVIDCTSGTFTVSLTAAATIGDGFSCGVMNSGSGTITVDPNGAETIRDSAGANTTIALAQGESIVIQCDGSNWKMISDHRASSGSGAPFIDSTAIIKGSGDATKLLRIEADGITTATTRVWTAQDSNLTVAGIDIAQTFTATQTFQQGTLGNAVTVQKSTATNDDPTTTVYQNRVATTDATTTTLHTFALADNTMYRIQARIWGRRTGGSAGTAGDSCYFVIEGAFKRTSAGGATAVGMGAGYTILTSFVDNMAFGFGADLSTSGNNVLARVTGDTNNNYTWHGEFEVSALSS